MPNEVLRIVKAFYEVTGLRDSNYRRHLRGASRLLRRADGDIDLVFEKLRLAREWFQSRNLHWNLNTVVRHFHELKSTKQEKVVEIDQGTESIKELLKKYGGKKNR